MVRVLEKESFERAVNKAGLENIISSELEEHSGYSSERCDDDDTIDIYCEDCNNVVASVFVDQNDAECRGAKKGEILVELKDYDFKDFTERFLEKLEDRYTLKFVFAISDDCENLPTVSLKRYVAKTTEDKISELESQLKELENKVEAKESRQSRQTSRKTVRKTARRGR